MKTPAAMVFFAHVSNQRKAEQFSNLHLIPEGDRKGAPLLYTETALPNSCIVGTGLAPVLADRLARPVYSRDWACPVLAIHLALVLVASPFPCPGHSPCPYPRPQVPLSWP